MSDDPAVVDGQATELPSTDIVPAAPAQTNLFRTDDPVEVVAAASKVADALRGVLRQQKLTATISGREHVLVEGWTTLGSMLGVVPIVVWTRKLEDGWEARVEARTLDGRVVGAAEAQCLRGEKRWKTADDYALRSMAQTRSTSKALRGPLGFVATLAGYDATPAEEMSHDAPAPELTEASDELHVHALNALSYLLFGDVAAAEEVEAKLAGQYGGRLPAVALQAIVIAAKAVKDNRERAADK